MEAFFDQKKHPKIKFRVKGTRQSGSLEAILDTGFDGYLSLPVNIAISLGLELIGVEPVQYADGRTSHELVFSIEVVLDDIQKTVSTTLTSGAEPLVGTALFDDYELRFNFPQLQITVEKYR